LQFCIQPSVYNYHKQTDMQTDKQTDRQTDSVWKHDRTKSVGRGEEDEQSRL